MYHVGMDVAARALERWAGDPETLEHVATSGNAVYRFRDGDAQRILRLTHPGHRTLRHNEAEMAFLLHLDRQGQRVNTPLASALGRFVEEADGCSASVLTWAPGIVVTSDSPHWNEAFFREWGRNLGGIHRAATSYAGPTRWDWREEGLIVDADVLIPADDHAVREEKARILELIEAIPQPSGHYGMIHADFAPGNFHYVPGAGITSFDFGNCCNHWFVSDIAISFSVLRRYVECRRYGRWLLDGYREVFAIDATVWGALDTLLQLRILYVLLSRLRKFGPHPDSQQRRTLATLRNAVLSRFRWPEDAH
jgi:amicoumacin kinase